MRTHTFYIVAGDRDPVIPVDASRSAVRFLRRIGAAASFYEQPDGVHSIASLAPAIGRAWSDMFAGVVRTNDGLTPTPVDTGSGQRSTCRVDGCDSFAAGRIVRRRPRTTRITSLRLRVGVLTL